MSAVSVILNKLRKTLDYLSVRQLFMLGDEPIEAVGYAPTLSSSPTDGPSAPTVELLDEVGFLIADTQWTFYFVYFNSDSYDASALSAPSHVTTDSTGTQAARITGIPSYAPPEYGNCRIWLVREYYDGTYLVADVTGESEYIDDGNSYYDWYGGQYHSVYLEM